MQRVATETGVAQVMVNDSESPLAWLARRKGRDGRAMIDPAQFRAGERLRADFTRAHLTPRITSSWSGIGRTRGTGGGAGDMTEMVIATRLAASPLPLPAAVIARWPPGGHRRWPWR